MIGSVSLGVAGGTERWRSRQGINRVLGWVVVLPWGRGHHRASALAAGLPEAALIFHVMIPTA
jgi:hypothetical protein